MTHLHDKFTWDLLHEKNTGDQNSSSQSGSSIGLAAATRVVDCSPQSPSPQYLQVVWECVQWEWLCVKVYVLIIVLTVPFPPRDKTLGTIAECCDVSKTPRPAPPTFFWKGGSPFFYCFWVVSLVSGWETTREVGGRKHARRHATVPVQAQGRCCERTHWRPRSEGITW